jgi:hypothetical protein
MEKDADLKPFEIRIPWPKPWFKLDPIGLGIIIDLFYERRDTWPAMCAVWSISNVETVSSVIGPTAYMTILRGLSYPEQEGPPKIWWTAINDDEFIAREDLRA